MGLEKEYKVDLLNVHIYSDRASMGAAAGALAADCIRNILSEKDELNIMFAASPSQNEMLDTLVKADGIDWSRINAYHMDEYVGISPEHPAHFRNYLKRMVFDKVSLKTVNLIDVNAKDPVEEAHRYGKLLLENPIDICLLGVGENGHLAFNDPPAAKFHDKEMVKVVTLEERCRWQQVHDGGFERVEQVPASAVTVTVPALMSAKVKICCVPGAAKAEAIRNMLHGPMEERCPASILRNYPDAQLYLDLEAASMLL